MTNIRLVFTAVKETILQHTLKNSGLLWAPVCVAPLPIALCKSVLGCGAIFHDLTVVVSYPSRWHCISPLSRPSFYTLPSFLIPPHVFNAFGPQFATRPYQFYIRRLQMLLAIKPPHSRATHTASTDTCLFLGRSRPALSIALHLYLFLYSPFPGSRVLYNLWCSPLCCAERLSHSQIETPLMLGLTAPAGCTSIRCPDKTSWSAHKSVLSFHSWQALAWDSTCVSRTAPSWKMLQII